MPRYFFNTRIGETLIPDPEGEELRDPDHAWEIARATIRQILQEEGKDPSLLSASLEVTDASGEIDVIKMLASDVANALGAGTGDMGGKRDRKGEGGRLATELLDAQNDSDSAIMLEDHLTEVGTSSLWSFFERLRGCLHSYS